ncbi:GPO family capsid scaffolding protein [Vibrio jasicida]|uniref:GPO family capsid scaffolding protein n=1 Tax=Vibrio jasicida TaxID=766224 RepID=A0ABW7JEU0_9VIBR
MALETGYKIIGTAGDTVDGRVIDEKWLKQLVKNYSTDKYVAVINLNHWNPKWYGTYGKVLSVKLTKNDEGKVCVAANIEPNQKLIDIAREEILFTSMEIDPDFQKSGEAYLIGLAVTPKPASVGTEQISFSSEPLQNYHTTDFYQFDFTDMAEPDQDTQEGKFRTWLKKFMTDSENQEEEPPMSGSGVDEKKLEELTTQLSSLTTLLSKQFSTENTPPKSSDDAVKLTEQLAPILEKHGIKLSIEQPKSDSERIDDLFSKIDELGKKLGNEPDKEKQPGDQADKKQLEELQQQISKISETLNLAINGEKPGTDAGEQANGKDDDSFV